jgi:hypothetical protein
MRLGILRRIWHNRAEKRTAAILLAGVMILLPVLLLALRARAAPLAIPIFESVAESRVKGLVSETAQELIAERESGDFCTLTYASDGSVKSVWVDSEEVNRFLTELTRVLEAKLSDMTLTCRIRSGDLICPRLFSGSGVPLTVRGSVYGGVSARTVSGLSEGGLNQTLHRLEVEITAPLTVTVLGEETRLNVTARVLIGEAVIVGTLPGGIVVGG